jgi:hypothetical protein
MGMSVAYVLGRFRKLRTAVLVGSALANDDVRHQGRELMQQGTDRIASSPEGQQIASNSTRLVDVARTAAISTIAARMEDLSDRLAKRGESLQALQQRGGDDSSMADQEQPEDEDQPEDELGDEDEPEDELEDEDEDEPEDELEDEDQPEDEGQDESEDEPAAEKQHTNGSRSKAGRRGASTASAGR